jgi:hypothetical protein
MRPEWANTNLHRIAGAIATHEQVRSELATKTTDLHHIQLAPIRRT